MVRLLCMNKNSEFLQKEAAKCRSLAARVGAHQVADALNSMATSYERRADGNCDSGPNPTSGLF